VLFLLYNKYYLLIFYYSSNLKSNIDKDSKTKALILTTIEQQVARKNKANVDQLRQIIFTLPRSIFKPNIIIILFIPKL